jgi:hypothetical protein
LRAFNRRYDRLIGLGVWQVLGGQNHWVSPDYNTSRQGLQSKACAINNIFIKINCLRYLQPICVSLLTARRRD